jgi:hypothetical protein
MRASQEMSYSGETTPLLKSKQHNRHNHHGHGHGHGRHEHHRLNIELSETDNVAVSMFTINRLATKSLVNFWLAILCLVYVAVNVVCLLMNSLSHQFRHDNELVFHLMEFWATFFFSIVSLSSFVFSRRPLYQDPTILKILLFTNIVFSAVPAMLVSVDLHTFDLVAHEMEYVVGVLQAIMDMVILSIIYKKQSFVASLFFIAMALAQIIDYNFDPNGEQHSHFLEFIFEIGTATILFLFCVDNKLRADDLLCELLHHGSHAVQYCNVVV